VRRAGATIDADDGEENVVTDAMAGFGVEEMSRGRAKHLARHAGIRRRKVRHIDHGLDPVERAVEPGARVEVDARGPRQDDRCMTETLDDTDDLPARSSCSSGNRNPHRTSLSPADASRHTTATFTL
jgi:hypothetical protein